MATTQLKAAFVASQGAAQRSARPNLVACPAHPRPFTAPLSINTRSSSLTAESRNLARFVTPQAATVDAPVAGAVKDYGVNIVQGKRLQVISAPVTKDTITLRCLDFDRDRFDIEFG